MNPSSLWVIFSFSFVVALSGAMAPGPLLTYTIIKTMQTERYGFLMGAWIIGGHALLEAVLIVAMLLGFATLLIRPLAAKIIGVLGGAFLVYMGINLVVDILRKRLPQQFDPTAQDNPARSGMGNADQPHMRTVSNPLLGGVLISMSNPYWWIWWATIGLAFMFQFGVSLRNWPALLAFLVGHEFGDLAWYTVVSALVYFGRRKLNTRVYHVVLTLCGLVMIGFGVYVAVTPLTA